MGRRSNTIALLVLMWIFTTLIAILVFAENPTTINTGEDYNETCTDGICDRTLYIGKVNYNNGTEYKNINTTFESNSTHYFVRENDFQIYVPKGNRLNASIIKGNERFNFSLAGNLALLNANQTASGNAVTWAFSGAGVNATIDLIARANSLEKVITIKNFSLVTNFVFNGSYNISNPDVFRFSDENMTIIDSAENTYNTTLDNNNGKIGFVIPYSWISTASFPVFIFNDPTIVMAGNNASCYSTKGTKSDTNDTAPIPPIGAPLTSAENTSIALPDRNVVTVTGSSSVDGYVITNCTLPANTAIQWINFTTRGNTSGSDVFHLSVWNFTRGNWSGTYHPVGVAAGAPATLSSNVTNGLHILNLLKPSDNRTVVFMSHGSSTATGNLYVDQNLIKVSYSAAAADTDPPLYSLNSTSKVSGTQYNPSNNYGFQITWTDTTGVNKVLLETNLNNSLKNFSASLLSGTTTNGVWGINFTSISGAGTYQYRWYANDTLGYMNASFPAITYSVAQNATNPLKLWFRNATNQYLNQNMTITYNSTSNTTAMMVYPNAGTLNLYYDHVLQSGYNNTNKSFGAGVLNITINTTGNANYTANSTSWAIIVNQFPLKITVSPQTASVTHPTSVLQYCSDNTAITDCSLYRNGSLITNNTNIVLGVGVYNFTSNITDTANFTIWQNSTLLTVTQNQTNPIDLWFRNATNQYLNQNMTITYNSTSNSTAILKYNQAGTLNLYYDHILQNGYNNTNMSFGASVINVTANTTGNENYTANSTSWAIIIMNGTPSISITGAGTQTYPYYSTVTGVETNSGDIGCSYNLYRNGTLISNPESNTFETGAYNYTFNTTGCANFTGGSTSQNLVINQNATNLMILRFNNGTVYDNQNIILVEGTQSVVTGLMSDSNGGTPVLWRGGVGTTSKTLTAINDTLISAASEAIKNNNYGITSSLRIDSNQQERILVFFNTSGIPSDANVTSATLKLVMTVAPSVSRTYNTHRITSSWNEGTGDTTANTAAINGTTHKERFFGTTWTTKGGDYNAAAESSTTTGTTNNVILSWNITQTARGWINGTFQNYGIIIKDSVEGVNANSIFRSRDDATPSYRPKIEITYTRGSGAFEEISSPETTYLSEGTFQYKTNTTGNINRSANNTGSAYNITVIKGPTISDAVFTTTGDISSLTFYLLNTMKRINASITDGNGVSYANITVTDSDNTTVVNNQQMTLSSAPYYNYSGQFQFDKEGVWTVKISANDTNNVWSSSTQTFSVIPLELLYKDKFFGFGNRTILSSAEITVLKGYGYNILEFEENITNMNNTWTSSMLPRILDAYSNTMKVGINFRMDYQYNSSAQEQLVLNNISAFFPTLATAPYASTVMYVSFEPFNRTFNTTQINLALNNITKNATLSVSNRIVMYAKDYNNTGLNPAYVISNPLIYVNETTQPTLINRENSLLRNNASMSRMYIQINNTLKNMTKDYHDNIMNVLRDVWNSSNAANTTVAVRNNGDIIVFNNQSSTQVFGINATGVGMTGKDVWDSTNSYLIEANTDLNFSVNISAYSATIVYFEDIDHISYGTPSNVVGETIYNKGYSNYTDGTRDGSWRLLDENASVRIELFDPIYKDNGLVTYYGWLNASSMSYQDMCTKEVIIIADNNSNSLNNLFNNCTALSNNTEVYMYLAFGDYANTDAWENAEKTSVDNNLAINPNLNFFIDEFDMADPQTNASYRMERVVDYIQTTKNKKVIVNAYTTVQKYGTWGKGGFMKESCINRWDGAVGNPTFSREDWNYEIQMSQWGDMHGTRMLCQAFNNRTKDGSLVMLDEIDEQNIYFASLVLGYDIFYITHPDFQSAISQKLYNPGADLSNGFSTDDNETYYRTYEKGIVYYNTSSGLGWISDNRVVNEVRVCFNAYVEAGPATSISFVVNKFNYSSSNGDYEIPDVSGASWNIYCTNINQSTGGRYLIDAWSGNHDHTGLNLGWESVTGKGQHSWYSTTLPNNWNAYPQGQNWEINLSINDSYSSTIDTTTFINQTTATDAESTNLTLSSDKPFNITIWSDDITISYNINNTNLTYLNGALWSEMNFTDTSDCDTDNPTWNTSVIGGESHKACLKSSGASTTVRLATPSLSSRTYRMLETEGIITPYPYFTNNITTPNSPQTYSPSLTLNIQVQINDTTGGFGNVSKGFVRLGRADGTSINFTLTNNTAGQYWYNFTQASLGQAGTLNLTYYANNTLNNWNVSDTVSYIINADFISITLSPSTQSISYGTSVLQYCSDNSTAFDCKLYLNGADITAKNNTNEIYGAGAKTFKANVTANTVNYTWSEQTEIVTINKATLSLFIASNGTQTYPYTSTAQGWETNTGDADITYWLTRNKTLVDATSPYFETVLLGAGTYNYTFNTSSASYENWTANASGVSVNLVINKNTTTLYLAINGTQSDAEYTYPTVSNVTGWGCYSDLICSLYYNGTGISNPNISTYAIGVYIFTWNVSGGANYTDFSVSRTLTIIQAPPSFLSPTITPTSVVVNKGEYFLIYSSVNATNGDCNNANTTIGIPSGFTTTQGSTQLQGTVTQDTKTTKQWHILNNLTTGTFKINATWMSSNCNQTNTSDSTITVQTESSGGGSVGITIGGIEEDYIRGDNVTAYASLTNSSGSPIDATDYANITIYHFNGTIITSLDNQAMIKITTGFYYYNWQIPLNANLSSYGVLIKADPSNIDTQATSGFHVISGRGLTNEQNQTLYDIYTQLGNVSTSVWSYSNRNLTWWNTSGISNNVWNFNNRVLTWYNYNASDVWNYASRNLTYIDWTSGSLFVWNNSIRNLTYYNGTGIATEVWTSSTRTLTNFDYAKQATIIWNSTDRNLTYFDYNTQKDFVWNATNRRLTWYSYNASDVWNYQNRNLTYFDFATQGTFVWNATSRNLTWFDYPTQAIFVWNSTNRNLTFLDWNTGSSFVWNSTNRNLTYYNQTNSEFVLNCLRDSSCANWWINSKFEDINTNFSTMTAEFATVYNYWNCGESNNKVCSYLSKISANQTYYYPLWNSTFNTWNGMFLYWNNTLFPDWDTRIKGIQKNISDIKYQVYNQLATRQNLADNISAVQSNIDGTRTQILGNMSVYNSSEFSFMVSRFNNIDNELTTINSNILSTNNTAKNIWDFLNLVWNGWNASYLNTTLYRKSDQDYQNTLNRLTLIDENMTQIDNMMTLISSNQTGYFPTWNNTFYFWNNSYFSLWNSTGVTYFSIDANIGYVGGYSLVNVTAYLEVGTATEGTFECYFSDGINKLSKKRWNKWLTSSPYNEVISLTTPYIESGTHEVKCDLYIYTIFKSSASDTISIIPSLAGEITGGGGGTSSKCPPDCSPKPKPKINIFSTISGGITSSLPSLTNNMFFWVGLGLISVIIRRKIIKKNRKNKKVKILKMLSIISFIITSWIFLNSLWWF